MFVASVSTILFNGNPLLRYDAYYILCDLLEMPNLANRGQQYVHYLVKRYAWNVKDAEHQARGMFEKFVFIVYTVASTIYRVFLLSGILLAIADMAFFVGVVLALGSLVMWLFVPLFKFLRYLAVNPELGRTRIRAIATTSCFALLILFLVGLLPAPDRFQIEGIVESEAFAKVHAGSAGFLVSALASETPVTANETVIARLDNPSLQTEWRMLAAKEKEIRARIRIGEATDPAEAIAAREQLAALEKEKARVSRLLRRLEVVAGRDGVWVSPLLADQIGKYVNIGDAMGDVVTLDKLIIRSAPGQDAAMSLIAEARPSVELRVKGRADLETTAEIVAVIPGGRKELPSPALGYPAGGETAVDASDARGLTPEEHVFEIRLDAVNPSWRMLPGQVVAIRFTAADKPLSAQAWRSLRQLLQRRFNV
jgi:putative peptide zinc metalloprotease protein